MGYPLKGVHMKLDPFIKIIIYTLTNVAVLQLTVHELDY